MKWTDRVRKTFPSYEKAREFISDNPDHADIFKNIGMAMLHRKLNEGFHLAGEHKMHYMHITEIISDASNHIKNGEAYIEAEFSAEIEPIAEGAA